MSDIVERLKQREAWWLKLHDYVIANRDEARGTEWFGRFNAIAQSIRGRLPVEDEAADTITTLRATISSLEGEKSKLREAIRSMNQEATIAIQAEPIPEFSQYSNHDDLPQGLRTHAHIKLAMLRATGRLALAETGEKP